MKRYNYFKTYFKNHFKVLDQVEIKNIEKLYLELKKVKKRNNKVMIFGNGAGASIASHVATDFTNVCKLKAYSFDNTSLITCYANDYNYENWVTKTIKSYQKKGDFVILISASGESKNLVNAAKFCNKKKIKFCSISGFKKRNKLNQLSKNYTWINSSKYNVIESIQLLVLLSLVDRFSVK